MEWLSSLTDRVSRRAAWLMVGMVSFFCLGLAAATPFLATWLAPVAERPTERFPIDIDIDTDTAVQTERDDDRDGEVQAVANSQPVVEMDGVVQVGLLDDVVVSFQTRPLSEPLAQGFYIATALVGSPSGASGYQLTLPEQTTYEDNRYFVMRDNALIGLDTILISEQTDFRIQFRLSDENGRVRYFTVSLSIALPSYGDCAALLARNGGGTTSRRLSPIFRPEVDYWAPCILAWANEYELDPNIIATIMQIESCGDPEAISSAGARGLFQVMPHHFTDGENMTDPETNAFRGMAYYNLGLDLHDGDRILSFAGYNGGHGTVMREQDRWPEETKIYHHYSSGIYRDAQAGLNNSPRLDEWYRNRGAGLCWQAAERLGLND